METLLDVLVTLAALLCAVFLLYGALLCLPPFQGKSPLDERKPTSSRKRTRSASERLSASSR